METPTLIFLCSAYPHSGEYFIDDEMRVTQTCFDNIYIVTPQRTTHPDANRFVPENAKLVEYRREASSWLEIKALTMLVRPFFLKEILHVMRSHSQRHWWSIFKIQLVALAQARALQPVLEQFSASGSIFYSYWHDEKALALALFKQKHPDARCVARAHGWDVYAERHTIPYLPFKSFIFNTTDKTFSISQNGKDYFERHCPASIGKVEVSRLGRFNNRQPLFAKQNDEILLCTCSSVIPVKRVHLVVDILAELEKTHTVRWIHFGEGTQQDEVKRHAANTLQRTRFEFRGLVPSNKILDFYAENHVDLFLNTSSSEGIPVSIMEAISAGIPVVATAVGGTPEIVTDRTGWLLPEEFAPCDAARLIAGYLSSPAADKERLRRSAYKFWQENYDAERNFTEFFEKVSARLTCHFPGLK